MLGKAASTDIAGAAVATATPEWILWHLVRELAQHLGQLKITRDVVATGP